MIRIYLIFVIFTIIWIVFKRLLSKKPIAEKDENSTIITLEKSEYSRKE